MATEQLVETVAESLEDVAVATRRINPQNVGLVAGGIGIGLVVGFVIGWRFNRAKIRAEAFRQSEEEVKIIRDMYRNAAQIKIDEKPTLDEVIEERGYSVRVEQSDEPERPTKPPVPVPPSPNLVFDPSSGTYTEPPPKVPTIKLDTGKSKNLYWDFEEELANRTKERPYILHQDEFNENETEYRQETLTWYAVDGVLTDEDENKIEDPDKVVGLDNLGKFGHGSDDFNVLFVRNESMSMEYEVCRMPESYAEEVLGLTDEPSA